MQLRILYQDTSIVAVDKPAGLEVHPQENGQGRAKRTCLSILSRQINQKPLPAHRLDRATAGVLLFSLNPSDASILQRQFQEGTVKKTYYCVVRGWIQNDLEINTPLKDEKGVTQEARSNFYRIANLELPIQCERYPTTRLTLLKAIPNTGRFHQLRRHLAGISHPIIGDTRHGDKKLNRVLAKHFESKRLLLQANALAVVHPTTKQWIRFQSRWTKDWHKAFDLFGICPAEFIKRDVPESSSLF